MDLLRPHTEEQGECTTSFPFYFVERLEEAAAIVTPVHRWLEQAETRPPVYLIREAYEASRDGAYVKISPCGQERFGGRMALSASECSGGSACVSIEQDLEAGRTYLLTGFLRYMIERDHPATKDRNAVIPKAYIEWEATGEPDASSARIAAPSIVFSAPAQLNGPCRTDEKAGVHRSDELLDFLHIMENFEQYGEWNYFEQPVTVPSDASRLRFRFISLHPYGETQYSGLRLIPQDFLRRKLREGNYRYHSTNEYTQPLKKMVLLDDMYRSSLLACWTFPYPGRRRGAASFPSCAVKRWKRARSSPKPAFV